jgi:hypothetical protein
LGRIAQGIRDIEGTNTIEFTTVAQIPWDRQITYGRLVCDIRPQKAETHRVRLTVGGDRIDYPGETATKNAELTTSKCLWNSTILTKGARYMHADVNFFNLTTVLDRPEYMKLALSIIPQEIIDKYGLVDKEKNGQIYIQINKGMYGLRLANDLLVKRPTPHPRISSYQPRTWTLEARHPTNNLHPHRRRLLNKIRGQGACRPFTPGPET